MYNHNMAVDVTDKR